MSATVASIIAVGDVSVAQNVGFGVIALMMIVAAIRVVSTNDVVHAALWLVLVLAGVAAQYIFGCCRVRGGVAGARLHRRGDGAVPVRHHVDAGPDRWRSRRQQPDVGARDPGRRVALRRARLVGARRRRRVAPCRGLRHRRQRRPRRRCSSATASSARTSCRSWPSRSSCSPPRSAPSSWPARIDRERAC